MYREGGGGERDLDQKLFRKKKKKKRRPKIEVSFFFFLEEFLIELPLSPSLPLSFLLLFTMVLQLQTQNRCYLQWLCTIGRVFTSYMAHTRLLQGCRAAAGPPPGFLHSSCRYPTEHRLSSHRVPRDLLHGSYRPPADLLQGSSKAPTRLPQGSRRAPYRAPAGLLRGSC